MRDREYYYNPHRAKPSETRIPKDGIRKVMTITEMSARHHEIARRLLLGQSNVDIARDLGITPTSVSIVRNSPVVIEQLSFLSAKRDVKAMRISEQIAESLPMCVKYLKETIEDAEISDNLKSRNAFGLLAAGGHGATKNVNVRGVHAVLTPSDIQEIRKEAEQIGMDNGIVDADYDEDLAASGSRTEHTPGLAPAEDM